MALKATIYKAELQISDTNRHYYAGHTLTIAKHPSETDTRMMFRIVAFALNASDRLSFTRGLSTDDEPDLWQKDLSGEIELWVDLGQPDEKRVRKACGRARRVIVYCYSVSGAKVWWQQYEEKLSRFGNLSVISLNAEDLSALDALVQRNMELTCTIQDEHIWFSDGNTTIQIDVTGWKLV